MHLFVIYIGGAHQHSLIELHDMRFIMADTIEDTYEELKKSWWGTPHSLHLDAWGTLEYVDGFKIELTDTPPAEPSNHLYFVNLGGYDPLQFTELHKNIFVVAANKEDAKQKAVQQIKEWQSPHRDYLHEVDTILDLNAQLAAKNKFIHLSVTTELKPFEFQCRYTPIGRMA